MLFLAIQRVQGARKGGGEAGSTSGNVSSYRFDAHFNLVEFVFLYSTFVSINNGHRVATQQIRENIA